MQEPSPEAKLRRAARKQAARKRAGKRHHGASAPAPLSPSVQASAPEPRRPRGMAAWLGSLFGKTPAPSPPPVSRALPAAAPVPVRSLPATPPPEIPLSAPHSPHSPEAVEGRRTRFTGEVMRRLLRSPFDREKVLARGNCACICVVKDEGPYIHEYIHHHLHFGFHPIVVIVNRTTDRTVEIASRIALKHPSVILLNGDWLDYLDVTPLHVQLAGFANGVAYLRNRGLARHALLSDADEFWFTPDFNTPIEAWLQSVARNGFDQISLCWANQSVREKPYEPPFTSGGISLSTSVKSIISLTGKLKRTHYHICELEKPGKHLDGAGGDFVRKNNQPYQYGRDPQGHSAYVMHRIQRSEDEYLATLSRGNPQDPHSLKENRDGYLDESEREHGVPADLLERYHASLETFIDECGIRDALAQERELRLQRVAGFEEDVRRYVKASADMSAAREVLERILAGTRHVGLSKLAAPEDITSPVT